jgi:hypothetical protein
MKRSAKNPAERTIINDPEVGVSQNKVDSGSRRLSGRLCAITTVNEVSHSGFVLRMSARSYHNQNRYQPKHIDT